MILSQIAERGLETAIRNGDRRPALLLFWVMCGQMWNDRAMKMVVWALRHAGGDRLMFMETLCRRLWGFEFAGLWASFEDALDDLETEASFSRDKETLAFVSLLRARK